MRKPLFNRVLSVVLTAVMLVSLISATASAAAPNGAPDVVVFGGREGGTGRFPDVTKNLDGTLVAACYWSAINSHAPWDYGDPLGEIRIAHGSADGREWSEPTLMISPELLGQWGYGIWRDSQNNLYYNAKDAAKNNAVIDIEPRDPNFVTMSDGTLVFTFFTRHSKDAVINGQHYEDTGYDYTYGTTYIMYSVDEGYTWSIPEPIPCKFLSRGHSKRGDIAVYPDGQLLIPLYGFDQTQGGGFSNSNILAELSFPAGETKTAENGSWVWVAEYSTHDFGDGVQPNGVTPGDTETSFGVTELCGKEVTYALSRPSGNLLVSEDRGANWTLLETDVEDGRSHVSGENLQQPSLYRLKDAEGNLTDDLFATWSQKSVVGGRSIYGKIYTPGTKWNDNGYLLLYKNTGGGDMGDPTGIQLDNGNLFTIFYDSLAQAIGAVINTADELLLENKAPYAVLFEEDFEALSVDTPYNNASRTNAPYVTGWFWTNNMTKIKQETVGGVTNKYLNMAAPYEKTDGRSFDHTDFLISKQVTGDAFWQMDYKFITAVEDGEQAIEITLANDTTVSSSQYPANTNITIDDPFVIRVLQSKNDGNEVQLLYNGTVVDTVKNAFTVGETYTLKITRVDHTLGVKTWKTDSAEPDAQGFTYAGTAVRSTGYTNVKYTSTDWTGVSKAADPVASAWRGYIDNVSVSIPRTLTMPSIQTTAVVNPAFRIPATIVPADDTAVITWTSSNEAVATVAADGAVTPRSIGTTVITATCGELQAQCTVKITEASSELTGEGSAWVYLHEDFEDVAWGSWNGTENWSVANSTLAQVATDGDNTYLQLYANGSSVTRTYLTVTGDGTLSFDFKMDDFLTDSAWQSVYLMIGSHYNASFQIRQATADDADSGYVRLVNGKGVHLPVYYNGAADATAEVYSDIYKAGTDAPWYSLKAVKADDWIYVNIWEKGTEEPDGWMFKAQNAIFSGSSIQLSYEAVGAGTSRYLCLDNVVLSKNTEFSIVDDGSDTLSYAFDRDITVEQPMPAVTWSGDNEDVVTVDASGKLNFVGIGSATITATSINLSDTLDVTGCKLSFNMMGCGTQLNDRYFRAGGALAEPEAPTAEGLAFDGWYTDATCSTAFDFDAMPTEDVTVYAKWRSELDYNGDGAVSVADVLILLKAVVNHSDMEYGDLNGDGKIDLLDTLLLLKHIIK